MVKEYLMHFDKMTNHTTEVQTTLIVVNYLLHTCTEQLMECDLRTKYWQSLILGMHTDRDPIVPLYSGN